MTNAVELMFVDSAGQLRSLPVLSLNGVDAPREHAVLVYRDANGVLQVSSLDVLLQALGLKLDSLVSKDEKDHFDAGQVLAEWVGGTSGLNVKTFTFDREMALVWVRSDGGDCRVDPFGGTPNAATGIPCQDGIPQPVTFDLTSLKVYAANGVRVNVWGFGYA